MSENTSTNIEEMQLHEDIEDYLNVSLSNGFSKGTANVSARDMVKLRGLLKHYAKKRHPFTACFRDQIKHGLSKEHAAKRCAVLKDLIRGTTKWRSTERKKNLSEDDLSEFILNYEDSDLIEFIEWAMNLDDKIVNMILTSNEEDDKVLDIELEAGDIAWTSQGSFNDIRQQIDAALNDTEYGMSYWVEDIKDNNALVSHEGKHYYVIPFSVTKKGIVEVSEEDDWKLVEKGFIESDLKMSDSNNQLLAELFFTETNEETDKDGLVWKTFLREGTWKYSPGNNKPLNKPLTIVKSGKSDPSKLIISMSEIKKNFEIGAIQHVTVPLSHNDKTIENTGFVKKLRFGKDKDGRTTLEAAIDFTEPDIKEKIDRGTIPNVSGGIHLNYIDKESGKKFGAVLAHLALTSKPWLQGMAPFGVKASENLNVVGFSEDLQQTESEDNSEGGVEEKMTTIETENANTFLQELGLSEDEILARLSRYEELEREAKKNKVDETIRKWEEEKKSPAMIKVAKSILMADDGVKIELSENGNSESLTASELVERLMTAAPSVNLADDPVTDEDVEGEAPPENTTLENLSDEVKATARRLFLYERYSEEDAIAEAIKRHKEETTA